eukprot:gene9713-10551_t
METAEGTGSAGRSDLPEGIWSDPNANVDLPEAPSYGVEKMTTSGIAGNVGTSSVTATPVGNPSPDPSRSPTINTIQINPSPILAVTSKYMVADAVIVSGLFFKVLRYF